MSNVIDLLSRRTRRGEPALRFRTAADALAFAREQVADLERLTGSALLLVADDLDHRLAQVHAVLDACIDLHTHQSHESETR